MITTWDESSLIYENMVRMMLPVPQRRRKNQLNMEKIATDSKSTLLAQWDHATVQ